MSAAKFLMKKYEKYKMKYLAIIGNSSQKAGKFVNFANVIVS